MAVLYLNRIQENIEYILINNNIKYIHENEQKEERKENMKIAFPIYNENSPDYVIINDNKYVPENEQKSFLRMTDKEIKAILEVQNTETVIKVAKCCHGVLYHKVRK